MLPVAASVGDGVLDPSGVALSTITIRLLLSTVRVTTLLVTEPAAFTATQS